MSSSRARDSPATLHSFGRYITEGINLYRFLAWIDRYKDLALAAVEDCRSLERKRSSEALVGAHAFRVFHGRPTAGGCEMLGAVG